MAGRPLAAELTGTAEANGQPAASAVIWLEVEHPPASTYHARRPGAATLTGSVTVDDGTRPLDVRW